ncbi:MAG TPA: amidase [Thermomicrobiaceae bacterium]|nr:amidase [Thermomicrobiaceae bacterium]
MLDVSRLTIIEAAGAFRAGRISPLDLTRAYLERVERLDRALNSYVTVTAEAALAAARQATDELAAGHDRGPLHGIPLAYKDLFATAGIRTTAGARILADRVPTRDATVVRRLAEAGAIMLGKLNMLEFAYGVIHPDFGPARNPWNLDHSAGGSSSGSAVATAAGLCLGALGTDTGGSIRQPAAWCGIVGHKPTYGLVSRAGVDPLSWTLDHVGPMTRTVDDAAVVLEAIAGYDPEDPGSAPGAAFRAADLDTVHPGRLRVGVPRELLDRGIDREVRGIVEAAIQRLGGLGMALEEVEIPGLDDMLAAEMVIISAEATAFHLPWMRTRAEDYAPLTRDRLEAGAAIPAVHYLEAQRVRRELIDAMARLHERVDLLVTPATPIAAPDMGGGIDDVDGKPVIDDPDGDEPADRLRGAIRCTGPFNVTGAPAITVPCGWTTDRLPIGLQFTGRPFEDHVVLAAARAFEAIHGAALDLPTSAPPLS